MTRALTWVVGALAWCLAADGVLAHTSERGFIMLLPTHFYQFGGTVTVVLSFALLVALPPRLLTQAKGGGYTCCPIPWWLVNALCGIGFLYLVMMIAAGFWGSRDPLANPLPLTLWSLVWVGLTMVHLLMGNLWTYLNPWRGLALLGHGVNVGLGRRHRPLLHLPDTVGVWPAVLLLAAFVWLELVYPAPMDPLILAVLGLGYGVITGAGMALFGRSAWLNAAEFCTVFFSIVSRLAPFNLAPSNSDNKPRLCVHVGLPGRHLMDQPLPRNSLIAFVVLALASVSFDSFSRTFTWFSWHGLNPLEPPGRSAMIGINTLGLLAAPLLLWLAYLSAVVLGAVMSGKRGETTARVRVFVVSIIPIAVGYHVAHYLPAFSVDAQYAVKALGDPLALGWNVLGLADIHVRASLLTNHHTIEWFWYTQVAVIVIAHVVAVVVAHALAARHETDGAAERSRRARRVLMLSELPLTVLMAAYTLLGLWLLSTPTAG